MVKGWDGTSEIAELGDTWRLEKSLSMTDPDTDSLLGLVRELGCVKSQTLVKQPRGIHSKQKISATLQGTVLCATAQLGQ